jgi:hypothetical protein
MWKLKEPWDENQSAVKLSQIRQRIELCIFLRDCVCFINNIILIWFIVPRLHRNLYSRWHTLKWAIFCFSEIMEVSFVMYKFYQYAYELNNMKWQNKWKLHRIATGTWGMDHEYSSPFLAHMSWKLKWAFLIARCPASVCLSVCKLLHFRLLLQNHWTNFIQTWHKSSLGEGDSRLFKGRG